MKDHELRFLLEVNINALEYLKSELEAKEVGVPPFVGITIELNLDIMKAKGWERSRDEILRRLENESNNG